MNRVLVFLILCLILPISSAFSRPWFNETWLNSNPNIWTYGIEYWWNLPEFDRTIKSMDFNQYPTSVSSKVKNYLDQSISYGETSQKDMNNCILKVIVAVGSFSPSATFLSAFANSSDCRSYKRNWIKSIDSALLALEESDSAAKSIFSSAKSSYNKLRLLGLCDQNYSGFGSESCHNISIAFAIIENNLTDGSYGQYPLFLSYTDSLNIELTKSIPDLSSSGSMLSLIWADSGAITTFSILKNSSDSLAIAAENEFQFKLKEISNQKSNLESSISDLNEEELDLITDGVRSNSIDSVGSISEIFNELKTESDTLAQLCSSVQLLHSHSTEQSYLSNSLVLADKIKEDYSSLLLKSSLLKNYSEVVVIQKHQEASDEIADTEALFSKSVPSSNASILLSMAKKKFDEAKLASTLGSQFYLYSKSAAYARLARSAGTFESEVKTNSYLTQLETLISLAEKDGINVVDEKASLSLLNSLHPAKTDEIVLSSIANVILKAKSKYESDLLAIRNRIKGKLLLIGSQANSISEEMQNYEFGLVDDGVILFPDAIGSLKKLKTNYQNTEFQLDKYANSMVSNSLSTSASPIFGVVVLDKPTDIYLDLLLANGPCNASNVKVPIDIGLDIPFLYSDIKTGKDELSNLFSSDGQLFLIFKQVEAFDLKRIKIQKSMIIAHTLSETQSINALDDGFISVSDTRSFELDYPISGIDCPADMEDCLVDGSESNSALSAGIHKITSEKIVYGYDVEITNIKTSKSGTKTKIEYEISILSNYDLISLPINIENQSSSEISSVQASVSGASIKEKKSSNSQVSIILSNVKKDQPITLRVSYLIDDPLSYVIDKLNSLDDKNQSVIEKLIESAQNQVAIGDYTSALELITQAQDAAAEYDKQNEKTESDYATISKKVSGELSSIETILSNLQIKNNFTNKLTIRKNELEAVIESNLTKEDKLTKLKDFDFNWLPKEVNSFKKNAYSELNDLKERFYLTGNFSIPEEFSALENALTWLETTGQINYTTNISNSLEEARLLVEKEESRYRDITSSVFASFNTTKSQVLDLIDEYNKQSSAAKGTEYSSLFTETGSKLTKLIDDTEKLIGKDPKQFLSKMNDINISEGKIRLILDSIKKETETKISTISSFLSSTQFDPSKKSNIEAKFQSMKDMADRGDYINALRAGNNIIDELESSQEPQNQLFLFSLAALVLLAGLGFYLFTQNKPKELRKLPSLEEAI